MNTKLVRALALLVVCLASSALLWAHHGDAGRYNEESIVITGTLVEVQMVNPHSLITFEAELGAAQTLVKQFGGNKNTMKVGEKLTITGRQAKNGAPYMNLTEKSNIVQTESGKEIYRTANYGQ